METRKIPVVSRVGTKVAVAIGVVIVMHLSIVVISHIGLARSGADKTRHDEADAQAVNILEINQTVTEIKRNVMMFTYTGYRGSKDNVRQLYTELQAQLMASIVRSQDENDKIDLELMSNHLKTYMELFDTVADGRERQQQLMEEVMVQVREDAVKQINASLAHARSLGNHEATLLASRVLQGLLTASVDANRFLNTLDAKLVRDAKKQIASAKRNATQLSEQLSDSGFESDSEAAADLISQYEATFMQLVQTTRSYLYLVNVVMAGEAAEFSRLSLDLKAKKLDETRQLGAQISSDAKQFRLLSDVIGVLTILIGGLASWWLRHILVPPLNAITKTLLRLAQGERDIVVPGLKRRDEIGQMAVAAEVFKDKAGQTEALLEKSQQLESELRETDTLFRSAFNNAPIGVALVGLDGKWLSANQALCDMLGYFQEELLKTGFHTITHPSDLNDDFDMVKNMLDDRIQTYTLPKRFIHKSGRIVWAQMDVSLVRLENGTPKHFVSQIQDITARKEIELVLNQYRSGVDQAALVAITDARGTITHVNDKFCEVSQYSRQELLGQNHRMINSGVHPKSFFVEMYKALATDNVWHNEVCNRAKDGSLYWVDTTVVAFRDINGKIDQYVAIRIDITDKKDAIKELEDKTAEMEQFTYTVSHDLKSPLVSCAGLIDCAHEDLENGDLEEVRDSLNRITRSIGRMEGCIRDLLELSRVGRVRHDPEWIDMNRLLGEMMQEMDSRFEQVNAVYDIGFELPMVHADRVRVRELFENLLSNALKYACDEPNTCISVGTEVVDGHTCFYVRDTGPGIAEQYHERIFGLFQRLSHKKEGSGVGLTIVARIMEIHGGRVWIESREGEGTTFWLEFPANRIKSVSQAA